MPDGGEQHHDHGDEHQDVLTTAISAGARTPLRYVYAATSANARTSGQLSPETPIALSTVLIPTGIPNKLGSWRA